MHRYFSLSGKRVQNMRKTKCDTLQYGLGVWTNSSGTTVKLLTARDTYEKKLETEKMKSN